MENAKIWARSSRFFSFDDRAMIKIFLGDDRAEDQVAPWPSKVLRGALDRGINLRAAKLILKTPSKF